MIEALADWLGAIAPDRPRARDGIVLSLYRTSPKAVVVLLDDRGAPCALVKVARDAAGEPSLLAEHAALDRLERRGGAWLRTQAPAPIGLARIAGRLALAQSYVDGVPMTTRYYTAGHTRSRRRVATDFDQAARWMDRFRRETGVPGGIFDDDAIERWVRDPIARYRAEIGWSEGEAALFDGAVRGAESLRGRAVPLAGRHGDFWMGNLLVGRGGICGVVDWELSSFDTLPIDDCYKFPTSYSFYLNRAYAGGDRVPGHRGWAEARAHWRAYADWANLAGFGYAFFGRGWFPSLVRMWISERTRSMGLGPDVHPIFFPVFLARQATTLADPAFRDGYRAAVVGLSRERRGTWLWNAGTSDREGTDVHA